jgi:hypothetical protein
MKHAKNCLFCQDSLYVLLGWIFEFVYGSAWIAKFYNHGTRIFVFIDELQNAYLSDCANGKEIICQLRAIGSSEEGAMHWAISGSGSPDFGPLSELRMNWVLR